MKKRTEGRRAAGWWSLLAPLVVLGLFGPDAYRLAVSDHSLLVRSLAAALLVLLAVYTLVAAGRVLRRGRPE